MTRMNPAEGTTKHLCLIATLPGKLKTISHASLNLAMNFQLRYIVQKDLFLQLGEKKETKKPM